MDAAHRQQQPQTTDQRRRTPARRRSSTPSKSPINDAELPRPTHSLVPLTPTQIPLFPPPHVILHKDDANNKVFLAMARALLSVDNRATTVKDLADLAMNHGLACQNSSAATQAITTYIRMHNDRCDADHDQPLLLSHNMSGTDADDDLVPGLYSLQGGNPRKLWPNRKTNFRKNTTVWYLSRATGAPCPFARAGIRLCDYDESEDEEPEKDPNRRRSKHFDLNSVGQKRKRTLRSCAKDATDTESENDQDKPPQKKLTLRIKLNTAFNGTARPQPEQSQNDSDDDESSSDHEPMAVDPEPDNTESKKEEEEEWRLPPYPRRSISIPCYTPSYEGSYPQFPLDSDYRRSPSVAFSAGSPPPDSEDEADDFHITMTRTDNLPEDSCTDSESEGETQFESPGPRSPSAPLLPPSPAPIRVKEEPRDLQGMLDAWDDFDSALVVEPTVVRVEQPLTFKSEPLDIWDWDSEPTARIKQEDLSFDSLFPSDSSLSPPGLSSSSSSLRLTPEPLTSHHDDIERSLSHNGTVRLRSKTVPFSSSQDMSAVAGPSSLSVPPPSSPRNTSSHSDSATLDSFPSSNLPLSIASLIQSMNTLCSTAVAPSLLLNPISSPSGSDVVIVHTCEPCNPPISATQIEDISVYQMVLGNFHFLRRIDTDFVNLSPIVVYAKSPVPVITTIPNATIINKGSPFVAGIWIPLSAAQAYIKDHPVKDGEFDVFLSDQLYERFPSALQDFVRSNVPTRALNQFGRHFASTLQATQQAVHQPVPLSPAEVLARQPPQLQLQQLQNLISLPSPTSDAYALTSALLISERQQADLVEPPLNATEQEIFELCVVPDWDGDSSACSSPPVSATGLNSEPRGSGGDFDMQQQQEEEEEEDEDGDVSDTSSLTSLESSPEVFGEMSSIREVSPPPPQDATSSASNGGASSPGPPTSCDPDIGMEDVVETENIVAPQTKRKTGSARTNRPLRRSKRVADLAAHQQTPNTASTSAAANTRSRRRGSRNSLS